MTLSPKQRRRARNFAVQAIYQWQMAGGELAEIKAQYMAKNDFLKVDWVFFQELIDLVLKNVNELDEWINPLITRGEDSINPIEHGILRLATAELKYRIDVPFRVVLDEYIDLAEEYGAEDGHKFVNGVLDKIAAELRAAEYGSK